MSLVPLERVTRFIPGQTTAQFQRWASTYGDAKGTSLSILYTDNHGKEESLSITAPTADIYNLMLNGLQELAQKLQERTASYSQDMLYNHSLGDRADSDHSGSLDLHEIVELLSSANISLPTSTVKKIMKQVDVDHSGDLDFEEFVEMMNIIRKRLLKKLLLLQFIFFSITGGKLTMNQAILEKYIIIVFVIIIIIIVIIILLLCFYYLLGVLDSLGHDCEFRKIVLNKYLFY